MSNFCASSQVTIKRKYRLIESISQFTQAMSLLLCQWRSLTNHELAILIYQPEVHRLDEDVLPLALPILFQLTLTQIRDTQHAKVIYLPLEHNTVLSTWNPMSIYIKIKGVWCISGDGKFLIREKSPATESTQVYIYIRSPQCSIELWNELCVGYIRLAA